MASKPGTKRALAALLATCHGGVPAAAGWSGDLQEPPLYAERGKRQASAGPDSSRDRAADVASRLAQEPSLQAEPDREAARLWGEIWSAGFSVLSVEDTARGRYVVIRREQQRPSLSPRERQVFLLASRGLALKAIGAELGTSVATVGAQLQRALEKLGLAHRTQLVRAFGAIDAGAPETPRGLAG